MFLFYHGLTFEFRYRLINFWHSLLKRRHSFITLNLVALRTKCVFYYHSFTIKYFWKIKIFTTETDWNVVRNIALVFVSLNWPRAWHYFVQNLTPFLHLLKYKKSFTEKCKNAECNAENLTHSRSDIPEFKRWNDISKYYCGQTTIQCELSFNCVVQLHFAGAMPPPCLTKWYAATYTGQSR